MAASGQSRRFAPELMTSGLTG